VRARDRALGGLVGLGVRLLYATIPVRRLGRWRVDRLRAGGVPFVYAVWHGQQLLLLGSHLREPCTVLVSRSRDGGRLTGLLRALGLRVARGSSSRGAVSGARALLRSLHDGVPPVLAVDGPRGPAGTVAPGAARIAAKGQALIVPVATAAAGAVRLSSWDRAALPLPGRRQVVLYGRPIPGDADGVSDRVSRSLTALTARAEALCR